MHWLMLTPVDVWTVRDARPFDVGGVSHARSVWPPSPWTLLGALRTLLCELMGTSALDYGDPAQARELSRLMTVLGPADGAPTFGLGAGLMARPEGLVAWPVPADVVTVTSNGRVRLHRLRCMERRQLLDYGCAVCDPSREYLLMPPLLPPEQHPDKTVGLDSFTAAQLRAWLDGRELGSFEATGKSPADDALASEPRIGIRIEPGTNTVEEGMFYIRTAYSLKSGWNLALPVVEAGPEELPWRRLDRQLVRLGADGHLAEVRYLERAELLPPPAATEGRATLLFLSPVRPADLDRIAVAGTRVSVLAVGAGRPIAIGGWQLRQESGRQVGPRRLVRYYPPGTVAYVETKENLGRLHATSIAADPEEKAAGFGFCLIGRWPRQKE